MSDRRHLFAYGTLELPEVMERVSGGQHASRPAVLQDHRRRLLRGKSYPGLVVQPGERTEGVLYLDLGSEAWRRLDAFEDDLYERREVSVSVDGRRCAAFAYLVPDAHRHLLGDRPWDREVFRKRHLAVFRDDRPALRR